MTSSLLHYRGCLGKVSLWVWTVTLMACSPSDFNSEQRPPGETSEERVSSLLGDDSHLVDFNDIRKHVFASACLQCHNGERQEAGLDLNDYDQLVYSSQPAWIKPYHPQESPLLLTLYMDHEQRRMPPTGETALTDEQKELLHRWVAQGAPKSREENMLNDRPESLSEELAGYLQRPETIDYPVVEEFVFQRARCTHCHTQGGERADNQALLFGADLSSYERLGFLNAIVPGRLKTQYWVDEQGEKQKRSGSRIYEMLEPQEEGNRRLEAKGAWPLHPLQKEILRLWILNCAVKDASQSSPREEGPLLGQVGKVRLCGDEETTESPHE